MKFVILFFVTMFFLLGCETSIPDKKSPESAFIRLSRCIDTASTDCLFWELDNETRWTVSSVHKLLSGIRAEVEKSYPEDSALRASVYGKWKEEAAAKSSEEMFSIMCAKTGCLKQLAKGFGAVKKVTASGNTATVETVRDETFHMRKIKGTWGIVLFEKELDGEKIRLSDSFTQVRRNAAEYEQQRLAIGQK